MPCYPDFCLPLSPLFINKLQRVLYLKTSLLGASVYKTLNSHPYLQRCIEEIMTWETVVQKRGFGGFELRS